MEEKSEQTIYNEFVSQLCTWGDDGTIPSAGNQDIGYGLALQRKRLEKYHTKIKYQLKPQEDARPGASFAVFSDVLYTNKLVWKPYQAELDYYMNDNKCLSVKDNKLLYTIITWLNHGETQASYCCPNCGAISDVSALLQGCPYCNTRFVMSDLFPKITNFYFLRDYSMGEKAFKNKTAIWMLAGGAIGFLICIPGLVVDLIHGDNLLMLLFSTLLTAGVFAAFGYFAMSLSMFGRVMKDAFKLTPRAAGQISAKKRLTEFMKPFDPGFTFEYFFGKVQAQLKILMFTDDRSSLPVYEGNPEECGSFDNLVDAQFDGAVSLNASRISGAYCYLDMNVFMTDIYSQGNQLKRKSEVFQIGLCRNISRPVDYGFSIKKVNCRSCGASFDATRQRFCSYCGTRYDLKEDDWVITYVRKK